MMTEEKSQELFSEKFHFSPEKENRIIFRSVRSVAKFSFDSHEKTLVIIENWSEQSYVKTCEKSNLDQSSLLVDFNTQAGNRLMLFRQSENLVSQVGICSAFNQD